jgi:hypothetical protein
MAACAAMTDDSRRHCEAAKRPRQSIFSLPQNEKMDCFAALAMTLDCVISQSPY